MRKHTKMFLTVAVLLVFLSAYCVGYFLAQPKKGGCRIGSRGQIIFVLAPLHIEVAPKGYPVMGESWTVFVYEVTISSGKTTFKPYSNSSVVATVKFENYAQTYNLSVNNEGQATFKYLPEYRDVAFQAFSGDFESEKVVISEHYVSSEIVNYLSGVNGLISITTAVAGGLSIRRKKIGKILTCMVVALFCLFSSITAISLYSKFFQETTWGYPEKIFGQIITFTVLEYATVVGMVLLPIVTVISVVFRSKETEKSTVK